MLHMDSRRFFLPSSIRTFLVSPPPIRGLVYPDAHSFPVDPKDIGRNGIAGREHSGMHSGQDV